jgi:hypothetical protein
MWSTRHLILRLTSTGLNLIGAPNDRAMDSKHESKGLNKLITFDP